MSTESEWNPKFALMKLKHTLLAWERRGSPLSLARLSHCAVLIIRFDFFFFAFRFFCASGQSTLAARMCVFINRLFIVGRALVCLLFFDFVFFCFLFFSEALQFIRSDFCSEFNFSLKNTNNFYPLRFLCCCFFVVGCVWSISIIPATMQKLIADPVHW